MGCVTSTAKRRRRQAKNGYKHIDKRYRPRYSRSAGALGSTPRSYKERKK
jgi:hypothetical protein